jgi:large subunit ribosomal protein L2
MYINFLIKKTNKRAKLFLLNKSGRNFFGRICVSHRSKGHKSLYNLIDFQRKLNCVGLVLKIINVRSFTANLSVVYYENGLLSKLLISEEVLPGDHIFSGFKLNTKKNFATQGSSLPIKYINIFTHINCIETDFFSGAKLARAAGSFAILISKNDNIVQLKLLSG